MNQALPAPSEPIFAGFTVRCTWCGALSVGRVRLGISGGTVEVRCAHCGRQECLRSSQMNDAQHAKPIQAVQAKLYASMQALAMHGLDVVTDYRDQHQQDWTRHDWQAYMARADERLKAWAADCLEEARFAEAQARAYQAMQRPLVEEAADE